MGPSPPLAAVIQLTGRRCLVVGGGPVAARRVQRLVDAGGSVTVVAPEAVASIRDADVRWEQRPYRTGDLDGMWMVVTATGVDRVDAGVVDDATAAGILVNDATRPERSTLVMPAVASVGGITVSVHTGARSPALTKWLRQRIEAELDDGYPQLLELMASARAEMVAAGRPTDHQGWATALESGLLDVVREGQLLEARDRLRGHLGLDEPVTPT